MKKVTPKPRSRRRADMERKKAKVHRIRKEWTARMLMGPEPPEDPDPRIVGIIATTPAACSCWLCTTGKKYDRLAAKRAARRELHNQ